MNKLARIMAGGLAATGAFAQMALAGGIGYAPAPTFEDSGSDAGLVLVVAIAAFLVIKSISNPAPSKSAKDATDESE
jgi:hypothetical protein